MNVQREIIVSLITPNSFTPRVHDIFDERNERSILKQIFTIFEHCFLFASSSTRFGIIGISCSPCNYFHRDLKTLQCEPKLHLTLNIRAAFESDLTKTLRKQCLINVT